MTKLEWSKSEVARDKKFHISLVKWKYLKDFGHTCSKYFPLHSMPGSNNFSLAVVDIYGWRKTEGHLTNTDYFDTFFPTTELNNIESWFAAGQNWQILNKQLRIRNRLLASFSWLHWWNWSCIRSCYLVHTNNTFNLR